jgi:hypothetical protein
VAGTIRNLICFDGKSGRGEIAMPEIACHHQTDIGNQTYPQTTIGDLRKTYGSDFAKGCADNEKLVDVLLKLPSLRQLIRKYEARRFEQL